MKKIITIILVGVLFLVVPITAGISIQKTQILDRNIFSKNDPDWDGTFTGEIGFPDPDSEEPRVVGYMSGNYILNGQKGGIKGTMAGIEERSAEFGMLFKRPFLIGRIQGEERNIPIVGFIGFKEETHEFGGRFMSIVGPAPYFWGTYQES